MKLELNIKTLDAKPKSESTLIVDLLKKHGIPGNQAAQIFKTNAAEYIVRKAFMYDYYSEENGNGKILNSVRWLQSAIKNDYKETEKFLNWYKKKRQYILENGNEDLRRLVNL